MIGKAVLRLSRRVLGASVAVALALSLTAAPAVAQDKKVRLQYAGAFASSMGILGTGQTRMIKFMRDASGGSLDIRFFEPGALVPGSQYFDAVRSGNLDMAFTGLGFFSGIEPAFPIFNTVPFGPDVGPFLGWMEHGGGKQLLSELTTPYNIVAHQCGLISPEASGWFRKEIKSVEDMKGLKMRFFGLGAHVMTKMGVITQLLQPGEIFQALQLGTIDAAEFAMPAMDVTMGFYQVAKFYYFPGWHQPTTMIQLFMSKNKWAELSDTQKAIVQISCKAQMLDMYADAESLQHAAIRELESKGVQIRRWPAEILNAYRKAWDEVVKEESAKNANFAKVWNSLAKFRAEQAVWSELGSVR